MILTVLVLLKNNFPKVENMTPIRVKNEEVFKSLFNPLMRQLETW